MSRKTVPILMSTIAVLLIALVAIIIVLLSTPEKRTARERRSLAVSSLLSGRVRGEVPRWANLKANADDLASPLKAGGSLDDLYHYLSKDPGRREFARIVDRRRAEDYLSGAAADRIATLASQRRGESLPSWAPIYVATIRVLFDRTRNDILALIGVPDELTRFPVPEGAAESIPERIELAVERYASLWIPQGRGASDYAVERQAIRDDLLARKRFVKRMEELDDSWKGLAAGLYNLSGHPRWRIAVDFEPELQDDLDELTILVLAADTHRRDRDLMARVHDADRMPGEVESPGIRWMPNFSYYKNIPEITGQTADIEPTIYFAKVNLGYTFRDRSTQNWLNRRKDWLTDYFNSYFSETTRRDFSPPERSDPAWNAWTSARLKAEGIHGINVRIAAGMEFGHRNAFGVRELAFVRVNLLENP